MKLKLESGCTVHNVSVDGVNLSDMSNENMKNLVKTVISKIPVEETKKYRDKLAYFVQTIITTIIDESYTLNYGKSDENIFVDIVNTKSFRVRYFYDSTTQNDWITVNDETQYDIDLDKFKNVISELTDTFTEKHKDDTHECFVIYEQTLSDIISKFGNLTLIGSPCTCCGDRVYTYECNL